MAMTQKIIPVPVNYYLTFSDMVRVGHYDKVDSQVYQLFSSTRFRISGTVDLYLLFYDHPPLVTNGDLFRELNAKHKRAAETAELLALGRYHPNLQREFPIAAFGSRGSGHNGGHARYPCLDEFEGARRFTTLWDDPYANWSDQGGCILAVAQ